MVSLQAPSHGFRGEGKKEMKGWMCCGLRKMLVSPQLTNVTDVCVIFSSLFYCGDAKADTKSNRVLLTDSCGNDAQENIRDVL